MPPNDRNVAIHSNSGKGHFVKRHQITPGALGVGRIVNRLAVPMRHVGHRPAMEGCRDRPPSAGRWPPRRLPSVLSLASGWRGIVAGGDGDIHVVTSSSAQQMRTIRFIGHQAAAVERRPGANALGDRRRGPDDQRPAHAIAVGANFLGVIDFGLRVEERDVRRPRPADRAALVRSATPPSAWLGPVGWVAQIKGVASSTTGALAVR